MTGSEAPDERVYATALVQTAFEAAVRMIELRRSDQAITGNFVDAWVLLDASMNALRELSSIDEDPSTPGLHFLSHVGCSGLEVARGFAKSIHDAVAIAIARQEQSVHGATSFDSRCIDPPEEPLVCWYQRAMEGIKRDDSEDLPLPKIQKQAAIIRCHLSVRLQSVKLRWPVLPPISMEPNQKRPTVSAVTTTDKLHLEVESGRLQWRNMDSIDLDIGNQNFSTMRDLMAARIRDNVYPPPESTEDEYKRVKAAVDRLRKALKKDRLENLSQRIISRRSVRLRPRGFVLDVEPNRIRLIGVDEDKVD